MAPIRVANIRAERRHFYGRNFFARAHRRRTRFIFRQRYQHHAKLRSHGKCLRKNFHHPLRDGVGRDIVVGGLATQQKIAHTSADEIGLVPTFSQRANDFRGVLAGVRHRAIRLAADEVTDG